jgi:hypothetical protein
MGQRSASIIRAWRGERTQEMAAAILGVSKRTLQRAEEGNLVNRVVIRAVEICYACEAVSPAVIVSDSGKIVWRNALAAAVGVGDVGATLFGDFFTSADGVRIGVVHERTKALIAGTLAPTRAVRSAYVWRHDASTPVFRIRYLDLGIVFAYARRNYIYSCFAAEPVHSLGA